MRPRVFWRLCRRGVCAPRPAARVAARFVTPPVCLCSTEYDGDYITRNPQVTDVSTEARMSEHEVRLRACVLGTLQCVHAPARLCVGVWATLRSCRVTSPPIRFDGGGFR